MSNHKTFLQFHILCIFYSLGRADVKLRHTKEKIAENTVYTRALLSAHADKGEKGTISQMSDQVNGNSPEMHVLPEETSYLFSKLDRV